MKILFFVDDFMGGAGNVVQIISSELSKRGHDITICLNSKTAPAKYDLSSLKIKTLLETPPKNPISKYMILIKSTRHIIKSEKPDIVVSFLFGVSSVVGIAMTGINIPLIVSERSNPFVVKPKNIWKLLSKNAYRKASAIVVLFNAFKSFSGGKNIHKTVSIPNPVPTFNEVHYHSPLNNITFSTLGNFRPIKGFDLLIDAFGILCKSYPAAELHIYGNVTDSDIQTIIESKGLGSKIKLCGYMEDINEVFSNTDVYVMPSRQEGFPNALCEAMSYGLPCIAFKCHEGISEIITNRVNGILVEKENTNEMADAMLLFCNNKSLLKQYREEARKISDKYSVITVVDKWENLLIHTLKKEVL